MLVLAVSPAGLVMSMAAVTWISTRNSAASTSPVGVNAVARAAAVPGGGSPRTGGGSPMMGAAGADLGMMAGRVWFAGDGVPVASIAAARARAAQAAAPAGLRPGEVIWFAAGFYVELKDTAGNRATEVIVDPASGAVRTEPGPAMMWNSGSRGADVSEAQARTVAAQWLAAQWLGAHRPAEVVGSVDAYPGYYSVDTMLGGTVKGTPPTRAP
jgi:hypothetical protein